MATKLEFFDRELRLATADLEPAAVNAALARFAKQSVAEVISSGQAPAQYTRYVNGREGAAEESVAAPGPILYEFTNWQLVISAAIEELKRRVPRRSGRYAGSFDVLVNQRLTRDFSAIPAGAEVVILNRQPYTRKMESGANGTGKRHFDLSKGALNRRFFPAFQVQLVFLNVSAGVVPGAPYILKTSGRLVAAAQNRRSSVFRAGGKYLSRRADRAAGQAITYPALVITAG